MDFLFMVYISHKPFLLQKLLMKVLIQNLIPWIFIFRCGCRVDAGKWFHEMKVLDDKSLKMMAFSDSSHYEDFNKTLDSILIPRVPGTKGHEIVKQLILKEMLNLEWTVEEDVFFDETPFGRKTFSNIIATHDPKVCRHLTVACHYDSLQRNEFTFMGATDSAVPCAMMIHTAKILNQLLKNSVSEKNQVTLQFIFFDGEEAFLRWSRGDSLYGSRHLADKWKKMKPFKDSPVCFDRNYASYLDRMDVMVLLDLIGYEQPKFYNYFLETHYLYQHLVNAENQLNNLKTLETSQSKTNYFQNATKTSFIQDDHTPFLNKGVPILHLIPSPFPPVWHKESDNRNSLHHPTINNLNKILRVFIAEYLHLEPPDIPIKLNFKTEL